MRRPWCESAKSVCFAFAAMGSLCSCGGKSADLGSGQKSPGITPTYAAAAPPPASPGTSGDITPQKPWKLVDQVACLSGFTVDKGHVFWSATLPPIGAGTQASSFVGSCQLEHCSDSAGIWSDGTGVIRSKNMAIVDGEAYFIHASNGIASCSVDDCASSRHELDGMSVLAFAIKAESLYLLTDLVVLRCELADCDNSLTRIPMRAPPEVSSYGASSSDLRIAVDDGYVYIAEGQRIVRVKAEGGEPFEELVSAGVSGDAIHALAVRGDSVYFATSTTIQSCPKNGCRDESRVLATALEGPIELLVDTEHLYFLERSGNRSATGRIPRLSRCMLPDCTNPSVLVEDAGLGAERAASLGCLQDAPPVMDDHYVYFGVCDPLPSATRAQNGAVVSNVAVTPNCGIAVTAK